MEYEAAMGKAHDTTKAQQAMWEAHREFSRKSTFGYCFGDEQCLTKHEGFLAKKKALAALEAKNAKIVSDAKAKLGVMSEYGVEETRCIFIITFACSGLFDTRLHRHLFWRCFAGGKDFAKRSSWYDMMFMGISAMGADALICNAT